MLGTAGTAALIRILRANLLDELHKPYVVAARARGGHERRLLIKYPLRVALNPFVSTVGLDPAAADLGRHHRRPGAVAADHRAAAAECAGQPGHVPRRLDHPDRLGADGDRARCCRTSCSRGSIRAFGCGRPRPWQISRSQTERSEEDDARGIAEAAPWRLIFRAFFKHRLAVIGLVVLIFIYFVALFAEFLAPTDPEDFNADYAYAPPQALHLRDADGHWGLFVYPYDIEVDPNTYEFTHVINRDKKIPLGFFVKGVDYHLFGVIPLGPPPVRPGQHRAIRSICWAATATATTCSAAPSTARGCR